MGPPNPPATPHAEKPTGDVMPAATTTSTTAAPAVPRSAFTLAVADRNGEELPLDSHGLAVPTSHAACELVFNISIDKGTSPDTTDLALYRQLEKIGHALRELYLQSQPPQEEKFRPHFVRLFYVAQLSLEGDVSLDADHKKTVGGRLSTEAARAEIAALEKDLIEDEAPRIKNGRLAKLARAAVTLSALFLMAYALLTLLPPQGDVAKLLGRLGVVHNVAACFMLMWVGSFVGVCLAYAIRTHDFDIDALTCDSPDFLTPNVRLLLTGTFAAVVAMVAVEGLGDVDIGGLKLSHVIVGPEKAFILGVILGLGEQKLMGTVQARLGGLFPGQPEART